QSALFHLGAKSMTYDFSLAISDITPAQAQALFDALVLLIAPYPDSTAGYHEVSEDKDKPLYQIETVVNELQRLQRNGFDRIGTDALIEQADAAHKVKANG